MSYFTAKMHQIQCSPDPKLDLRSLLLGDGKGGDRTEGKGTGQEGGRGGAGGQWHAP